MRIDEKIRTTINYEMFELHEMNRDIGKIDALVASMKKYGWIAAYPAHVTPGPQGTLQIKAGHHRFEAARRLGIAVKYVVCDDGGVGIQELEAATTKWSINDYLMSYVRAGNPNYRKVKEYCDETRIPLMCAISLCKGYSAGGGRALKKFKSGDYVLGDQDHADDIKFTVLVLLSIGFKPAASSNFVIALSKMLRVEDFDKRVFVHKAKLHPDLLQKQVDVSRYSEMIEFAYNFGARVKDRLPLSFLADAAARERKNKLTGGKK